MATTTKTTNGTTTETFYLAAVAARDAGRILSEVQERTIAKHDRLRLADLDARWNGYVEAATLATYGTAGSWKAETASRNLKSRSRARRGLAPLETVAQELHRLAEAALLSRVAADPTGPVSRRIQAELDEAAALRAVSSEHWLAA